MEPVIDTEECGRVRTDRTSTSVDLSIAATGVRQLPLRRLVIFSGWILFPIVALSRIKATPLVVVVLALVDVVGLRVLYGIVVDALTVVRISATSSEVSIHFTALWRTKRWAETTWTGSPDRVAIEWRTADPSLGDGERGEKQLLLKYDCAEADLGGNLSRSETQFAVERLRPFVAVPDLTRIE
jgi:hypothetical protein